MNSTNPEKQTISPLEIRVMEPQDMNRVLEIYQQAIDFRQATFENDFSLDLWQKNHFSNSRFVLLNSDEKIVGWCALLKVSDRVCYKGLAETSIFLDNEFQGKGLGGILLEKLILDSEEQGFWTLQAQLLKDNIKAIKIHQKMGFKIVGTREKLSQIQGNWKDVLLLERRKQD